MNKVLILAYDFPPHNSVAAQRPFSWFEHFLKFGYYPVVITRHWDHKITKQEDCFLPSKKRQTTFEVNDNGTIIRTPFNPNLRDRLIIKYGLGRRILIRKILTIYFDLFRYFFTGLNGSYSIYKESRKYLQHHNVDFIIATGEPFILFKYASLLSSEFKIPWIADYRDCWSNNYELRNQSNLNRLFNKYYLSHIEQIILKSAASVTTVAPAFQKDLSKLLNRDDIELIFNGYTPFTLIERESRNEYFEIVYLGTLYDYQPVEIFLQGLSHFLTNNQEAKICVKFVGLGFAHNQERRVKSASDHMKCVEITNRLPHVKALEVAADADVLLLFGNKTEERIPAKIFDYLQLNKKILLVEGDNGILDQILKKCKAGESKDDVVGVSRFLEENYLEFGTHGCLNHQTINHEIFSRENQVKEMVEVFTKLELN